MFINCISFIGSLLRLMEVWVILMLFLLLFCLVLLKVLGCLFFVVGVLILFFFDELFWKEVVFFGEGLGGLFLLVFGFDGVDGMWDVEE